MSEAQPTYRRWLLPIAHLYGMGVKLRNSLFDWNILKSKSFSLPIICVGNLTVGGTGKTPQIEYLVRLLQKHNLHVAILSRGYRRKTKGFVLATTSSTSQDIGDEPCQMKTKFPDIVVAVDEDRCRGVERLIKLNEPKIDVILLDDAYQHRHIKAGLNILLTDYNRIFTDDLLLPAGSLREPIREKERAHLVVVTKCPNSIKPIDFNILGKKINLYPYQGLFFSQIEYGNLYPLFPELAGNNQVAEMADSVLLVTGIAAPALMKEQLSKQYGHLEHLSFPDHHSYKKKDIQYIESHFKEMEGEKKIIITTEKDGARLLHDHDMSDELKALVYVLPISMSYLQNREETFNQQILSYVRTNKRNC